MFLEPFLKKMQESRISIDMGRPGLAIEQYLRLMYLKHAYQMSYESLIRVFSIASSGGTFCGFTMADKLPDPTTLMKLTKKYGPEVIKELNDAVSTKESDSPR